MRKVSSSVNSLTALSSISDDGLQGNKVTKIKTMLSKTSFSLLEKNEVNIK